MKVSELREAIKDLPDGQELDVTKNMIQPPSFSFIDKKLKEAFNEASYLVSINDRNNTICDVFDVKAVIVLKKS